ncbi:Basic blue protein [Camellia lanceoleosa]|uniref:Basic blue protein n=1 Tax=Camellia lanceoleosa TaxID=1840588 RepID=A0ACC0IJT9_9ERIC|nr:Basic blue protein [Camellia lanceoleosa]
MSHQGRGNAIIAAVVLVVCMEVLLRCEVAQGSNFIVGDAGGWTFGVSGWPNGKSFKAGDILGNVQLYPPGIHNVVVVGKADHDNCNVPNGAKTYTSGKDSISLAEGPNYFICGIPGHCQAGVSIAVTAN